MDQVVYVANPVSGLIHVFRLEEGELVPLQEVQTGGEVQPLVISPDKLLFPAAEKAAPAVDKTTEPDAAAEPAKN